MIGPDKGRQLAGEVRGDVILAAAAGRHLFLSVRHATAPNGLFNGLIWPKAGCASIAYAADKLGADLAAQDRDAMILRAHTLRGLAGNIGATQLARLAGDIENQLKTSPHADAKALASRLADLRQCLAEVVAQASRFAHEMPLAAAPVMRPAVRTEYQRHALRQLSTS